MSELQQPGGISMEQSTHSALVAAVREGPLQCTDLGLDLHTHTYRLDVQFLLFCEVTNSKLKPFVWTNRATTGFISPVQL